MNWLRKMTKHHGEKSFDQFGLENPNLYGLDSSIYITVASIDLPFIINDERNYF